MPEPAVPEGDGGLTRLLLRIAYDGTEFQILTDLGSTGANALIGAYAADTGTACNL